MTVSTIDVRTIPPRERHPLIFRTFDALAPGQRFEIVNDHDPRPLREQFAALAPGEFDWAYLESGPDSWRVAITRVNAGAARNTCCGACGG